jgi:hypothetical protein
VREHSTGVITNAGLFVDNGFEIRADDHSTVELSDATMVTNASPLTPFRSAIATNYSSIDSTSTFFDSKIDILDHSRLRLTAAFWLGDPDPNLANVAAQGNSSVEITDQGGLPTNTPGIYFMQTFSTFNDHKVTVGSIIGGLDCQSGGDAFCSADLTKGGALGCSHCP